MRIVKIKNNQDAPDTYCGQTIGAGEYYTLQSESEAIRFMFDAKVNQHLWSDPAKISINNGEFDLDSVNGDAWLKQLSVSRMQEKITQDSDVQIRGIGFQFDAPANADTVYYWQIPEIMCFYGGKIEVNNNEFKDKIDIEIVDKDGIVYPAGTVLTSYITNWNIPKDGKDTIQDKSISDPIPTIFYVKATYKATSAGNTREVALNFVAYK